MKFSRVALVILLFALLVLIPAVPAYTWASANGCWTANQSNTHYVMWNGTGTSSYTIPAGANSNIWYLVVGGGGGSSGGSSEGGGGAGAGGLQNGTLAVTPGSQVGVTVGIGGSGGIGIGSGANGGNSAFSSVTAIGGGIGAGAYVSAGTGGSGGGGSGAGSYTSGASGTGGQGNSGGNGGSIYSNGGGGGGAGASGTSNSGNTPGAGGNGLQINITGTLTYYAGGGGGGGGSPNGVAGLGGGGTGSGTGNGGSGTANTGGGGAGGLNNGGSGGSGIVIIQYTLQPGPVNSSFTVSPSSGIFPLSTQFTDTSTGVPTSWAWFFDNITGNNTWVQFSTIEGPSQTFGAGNYEVYLNASNTYGTNMSAITWINTTTPLYNATFTQSPLYSLRLGMVAIVNDTSSFGAYPNTYWNWNFGDGSPVITTQNATHQYLQPGLYTITETTGNSLNFATNSSLMNVYVPSNPVVQFVVSATGGAGPAVIQITDRSTVLSPTIWNWTDTKYVNGVYVSGPTLISSFQNPLVTFGTYGLNTEDLIAENVTNATSIYYTPVNEWINTSTVVPSFTTNETNPNLVYGTSLPISFTDTSTGDVQSSVLWNFGDPSVANGNYAGTSLVLALRGNLTPFTDSSSFANAVTMLGNATIGKGPGGMGSNGGAMFFDGINASATVPSTNVNLAATDTISLTTNAQVATGTSMLLSRAAYAGYSGYAIIESGGNFLLYMSSSGSSYDIANGAIIGAVVPGTYQTIVISKSATTINGYVNGVLGSGFPITTSATPYSSSNVLTIGSQMGGAGYYYAGTIANLQLWSGQALPISAFVQTSPYNYQIGYFGYAGNSSVQIPLGSGNGAAHTYTSVGVYNITETAWDPYGGYAQSTGTVVVGVNLPYAYFTESANTGTAGNAISFTFAGYNPPAIPATYNWSWGDALGTNPYSSTTVAAGSTIQHVYVYNGIFVPNLTLSNANGTSYFNGPQITYSINTQSQSTWWTPHTVQITVMDTYGQRLYNVQVNATYNQTTMPLTWINQLYGIQGNVPTQMVNASLWENGVTGSDGTITFTMLGSIGYNFYLTAPQYGLNNYWIMAYPSDSMLNLYVIPNGQTLPTNGNSTYSALQGTYETVTAINSTWLDAVVNYVDSEGLTQYVNETCMFRNNDSYIAWNNATSPGLSAVQLNITLPNIKGQQYSCGYFATRSST